MKFRLVNVSPWILAAACSLLAIIIGVFAVNNYHREKQLMTEVLLQKGATILRFINAGSRARFRNNPGIFDDPGWRWSEQVQQVFDQTAEQPGVHFVMLADKNGNILAGSDRTRIGEKVDSEILSFFKTLEHESPGDVTYRIGRQEKGVGDVFQIAAVYAPLGPRELGEGGPPMQPPMHMGMGRGNGMMREHMMLMQQGYRQWRDAVERVQAERYMLLVELDLDQLNNAVKRQLLQIVILSLVLLLVGIGGWLSLLTLQGYKGTQIRLRRMRAFNDLLVSSLPLGLVATDGDGNIQIFNRGAEEILGIDEHEATGKSPSTILPPPLGDLIRRSEDRPGASQRQEIFLTGKDGRSRSLALAALSIVDAEERQVGTMLLIQDLSEVKKLEEELKRNERLAALGEMAAGVAHELRNPLSSIKGLTVLLKSKFPDNGADRETADILVREVERLNRSIGELLDYARPDRLENKKVSLHEILQKSISLIRVDADAAEVSIATEFCSEPDFVNADPDKLNQVFLNLFLNALQAMDNGGLLRVHTRVEEGNLICKIEDSGCGIDAEILPRVFDPYVTTKSDGTGLGLAMSAKIIEEHEGSIVITSTSGQGTTVRLSLPQWRD